MSQLSRAAEVVWLLELTATIRPNSAVMSVAEEAGITHFKTLLQRWAHLLCTVLGEPGLFRYLPSPYKVIVHPPKVGVIVITRWITDLAAPTASCWKYVWKSWLGALLAAHTGTRMCVFGYGYCLHTWTHTQLTQVFFLLYYYTMAWYIIGNELIVKLNL